MKRNNRVKSTNDIELKDRLVAINRVTKVTKGGRAFSFSAIVVVGNENGIVGWGLGKANEVTAAIAKGVEAAKKNLIRVPVHKGTIPHEQAAKFGGSQVILKPASHGTGVKAGGAMRAVLESVGITDVLAKSKGSSNPHNLVKATFNALDEMRSPTVTSQAAVFSPSSVVTVMVAFPFATALTFPFPSTVATFSSLVSNITFLFVAFSGATVAVRSTV